MPDEAADLLPPIDERFRAFVNVVYPRILRIRERVQRISFATPADEARLLALHGKRVLLLPNHPTATEPPVLFGLSRKLGEPFRYAAMDELFTGPIGAMVSRVGAFPIKRGLPDRLALKRCQESLLIPSGKLVLFAEGETHGQNDFLLPLNPGAAQIAFWTMEKLRERDGDAADLLIVPVAIKYQFVDGAHAASEIEEGLSETCDALGLSQTADGKHRRASLFRRTRDASLRVLAGIESEYDIAPDDARDTDERITALYQALEARIVAMLRISAPKEETIAQRMRTLFNAAFAYRARMESGKTDYEKRLQERREWIADACLADLRRVENFLGVRHNRIDENATLEQYGEMLSRLETELFGDRKTRPLRNAYVKIGEPISMRDRHAAYAAGKRQAVAGLTADIETQIRELLGELKPFSTEAPTP